MSASKEETKIRVKFVVDKQKKKVIFAEADNDFLDTLFSFLTLPMGTIVRLLQNQASDSRPLSLGSFTSLYKGLANLDPKYFCTHEYGKNVLLKSVNSSGNECCKLKVNIDDNGPLRYFICQDLYCPSSNSNNNSIKIFSSHNVGTCVCGKQMNKELVEKVPRVHGGDQGDGVFFTAITTFILADDLRVMENLLSSSIYLLNESGTRDMRDLEEKSLSFGYKEFIRLLKCSLCSKTPLTDFLFSKVKEVNSEQLNLILAGIDHIKTTTSDVKKISLKLMVRKSTKKILYGIAEGDFVDFIFSFLAIPLGSVLSLLDGNTNCGSIDNLYKSISKPFVSRQFRSRELMNKLISPCLASSYICKHNIFSLSEVKASNQLYCLFENGNAFLFVDDGHKYIYYSSPSLNLKDPKSEEVFLRASQYFMVTDDLVVTPLSSVSALSSFCRQNIHFADVEEQVVNIGTAQALSLLLASLHSKSALSKGINPFMKTIKKEP